MPNYEEFYKNAKVIFKDRIYNDYLRCYALGIDASCYNYTPKIVIIAHNEKEIQEVIRLANIYKTPIGFRAAGTSLSGQSSCDGVLVIIRFAFKKIAVSKNGDEINLGCGVVGINANENLKILKKKIGPDPATINTALIGGIVANNSSGMCCGVKDNSYKTLKSIRVILNDGTILDTADALSVANFRITHKKLLSEIAAIRDEINADKELKELITKKYKIKNTTGYSINSFVDFSDEIDILAHLFVGSEGTLGFISEARLKTIDDLEYKACALLFFNDIIDAANTIQEFAKLDYISSAEIMDYECLKAVSVCEELKDLLKDVKDGNTCVLIQTESDKEDILDKNVKTIKDISKLAYKSYFSKNESEYSLWWKVRKAVFPIVTGQRKEGTTVITEDICFKIEDLADGIKSIQALFKEFNFEGSIVGHALAGNIHFIITPNLNDAVEYENFSNLVKKMAQTMVDFKGSIKAEHGTGRMVAPFVEVEWGKKAYEINKRVKNIFDNENIFNPDVIICDDLEIYKKNIQEPTKIDDKLNMCMACGFCERFCPSNEFSLSPRQRIAVLREMQRLSGSKDEQDIKNLNDIKKNYEFFVNKSCAACGVCSIACPLGIDFSIFNLNYRKLNPNAISKVLNNFAYKNHESALKTAKMSLKIANMFDNVKLDESLKKFKLPQSRKYLPKANDYAFKGNMKIDNVIYFTSCLNKAFKPNDKMHDKRSIQEVFESLCKKAGIGVIYPPNDLCCGKAYEDYADIQEKNNAKLKQFLSEQKYPVVLDHTACSSKVIKTHKDYEVYDLSEYLLKFVVPRLKITKINEDIGLYVMCAAKKIGLEKTLKELASICTNGRILIDIDTYCCGFAGYKGFLMPKLNECATKGFKRFYNSFQAKRGFSTSSTCEVGLSDATNMSWQHIAYLLDECSE